MTARGLRPSLTSFGGRARKVVSDPESLAETVCGRPPSVRAAAEARNLRREQRRLRSCMKSAHGVRDTADGGQPGRMRSLSRYLLLYPHGVTTARAALRGGAFAHGGCVGACQKRREGSVITSTVM